MRSWRSAPKLWEVAVPQDSEVEAKVCAPAAEDELVALSLIGKSSLSIVCGLIPQPH